MHDTIMIFIITLLIVIISSEISLCISDESKILKIGIGLHNTEDPIKLEILNTQDEYNKNLYKI